jgi:threonine dehydrogenase-like Zn-dependent dehydrogenase
MVTMPQTAAVPGAGPTGAGIAQLARRAGARAQLHRRGPEALA